MLLTHLRYPTGTVGTPRIQNAECRMFFINLADQVFPVFVKSVLDAGAKMKNQFAEEEDDDDDI